MSVIERWECPKHGVVACSEPTQEGKRWCVLCLRFTMALVRYVPAEEVAAERQAVTSVVNIYGDETLHTALDRIGWPANYIGGQ